ncbi:TetR/AcrR family transcriptional regulator [Agromyces sp. Marseille-Q5079]|uniref:TetR/AcrR family transcriptional regulator n=1 Tax=Agromyces sp. Marseille-Q5079 TaxID=3439059 RepID=UPI003D9CB6F4
MVSSAPVVRSRKRPSERRAEIVREAASVALADGLERITLRAVAERLGVRPGLITHYFPAAEDLVIAAFVQAVADERDAMVPEQGEPLERLARMVERVESVEGRDIARLWLNARHLCRFTPALASALVEQEALDRARLLELIEVGVATGEFTAEPFDACIRIFIAVDGYGAYVNDVGAFEHDAYTRFVTDAAEWALGLDPGRLRAAIAELHPS